MTPSCSIIIRTLNEARYLGELLQAIENQSYPRPCWEVIIVDSGSSDETLAIANKFKCRVEHISRARFSFGRSLNVGCRVAQGDVLVFISGHCVPTTNEWLWDLVRPFHQPEIAVTYGRQVGGEDSKFSELCLFDKYFPASSDGGHQNEYFCNNANSAFRRSCWIEQNFNEDLTGLEDMHLARILVEAGKKVQYVPNASVFHYHNERWSQILRRYDRESIALRSIMPEIMVHWYDALRYFFAAVMSDTSKAIAEKEFWRRIGEINAFRFCQFYGAWRGNRLHRRLSKREKEKYFYPN